MSTKTPSPHPDLRVRRTHKLLWDALLAEMSARPFAEITVTDICERAMVHRTTFYKHYEDKYALLERGMRQMLDALMLEDDHMPPTAYSVHQPPPYFVRLFEQAAQHRQFYSLMVCGEGNAQFQKLVREYIASAASPTSGHSSTISPRETIPIALHAHYVAGAALSLLAWWLDNAMPLTPLQMARYLLAPHGATPSST